MFQNLNLNIDDISSTIDENIKSSSINYRGIYKMAMSQQTVDK